MKKVLLAAASALVLTSAVVSNASARDGFYLGIRGGNTNMNLDNEKKDNAGSNAREDFGDVWHISGALGYKYKYFRLEGEYIYRDSIDDTYRVETGSVGFPHSVKLDADSFMLNAYIDFMPNYWISPFITGGIGLSRLTLENIDNNGVKSEDEDDNNFSWMLGAGLSLRLNKCVNLDAGYRYLDMGEIGGATLDVHEVYGGLRFTF